MSFTAQDALVGLVRSRALFLKHLRGLRDDQWTWKPYPECKSIRETLVHLHGTDRIMMWIIETGKQPDWEGCHASVEAETASDTLERLVERLRTSHYALMEFLETRFGALPLATEIATWGDPDLLGRIIPQMATEDHYHAGQVAFIRQATDPAWDYYQAIYFS